MTHVTPEQKSEIRSIIAQHGINVVLTAIADMIVDEAPNYAYNAELETAILTNAHDIHKAADSITYRAWTGRDLYKHEVHSA